MDERFRRWFGPAERRFWLWGLGLVLLLLIIGGDYRGDRPINPLHYWSPLLGGALLLVYGILFLLDQGHRERLERLEGQVREAQNQVVLAYQRLAAVFRLSRQLVEAEDEAALVERLLSLCLEVEGVCGVSFVPLDERGQPQAARSLGDLPQRVVQAWLEYLASPEVRHRCNHCDLRQAHTGQDCPLLTQSVLPFTNAGRVICFPLKRGAQQLGMLNLYLEAERDLDPETRIWLGTLLDEFALALEVTRLRAQERRILRPMPAAHSLAQSRDRLQELLEQARQALGADLAVLYLPHERHLGQRFHVGALNVADMPWLDGLLQGGLTLGEAVIISEIQREVSATAPVQSLMMAPLVLDGEHTGVLLAASRRGKAFNRRHLSLLALFASQVVTLTQQSALMAEIERRAWLEERTRLAREIHDGLAQTLSFLKLQVAQLQNALQRGDTGRLEHGLQVCYRSLSEAYLDVREAIDGLRLTDHGGNVRAWLQQMVTEFETGSALQVHLEAVDGLERLPLAVQAQLVRIVQEALSNVRRHAQADQVWIRGGTQGPDWVLEVQDDGQGFDPDEVPPYEHHGLKGMRERAEKIGAEFQVISRRGAGTTVRLALPATLLTEASE